MLHHSLFPSYCFFQMLPSDSVRVLESVIVNIIGWSRPVRVRVLPDRVNVPLAVMFALVGEIAAGINIVNVPEPKVIVHEGTLV